MNSRTSAQQPQPTTHNPSLFQVQLNSPVTVSNSILSQFPVQARLIETSPTKLFTFSVKMERLDEQMSTLSSRPSTNLVGRTSDLTSSMAMKFTYKRFTILFIPVLAAVIVPPILSVLLMILNIITRGHAFVAIILSVGITVMICMKIKELSPSPQKSADALQSRDRIFGLASIFAVGFCRYFLYFVFPPAGDKNVLFYPFVYCGALSLGILFLSVLVALRFVGPCAIGTSFACLETRFIECLIASIILSLTSFPC